MSRSGSRRRRSMLGLGRVARPYRKRFVPKGMDQWDGRTLRGEPIEPGTVVTVTAHYGPFRVIEVRSGDGLVSEMSVGKGSLEPVTNVSRPGS